MFEVCTMRLKEFWMRTQQEAEAHQLNWSSELLLYTLIIHQSKTMRSHSEGLALNILKNLHLPLSKIQKKLADHLFGTERLQAKLSIDQIKSVELSSLLSDKLKESLWQEAEKSKSSQLNTAHLLLAIVSDEKCFASQLLLEQGVNYAKIAQETQKLLHLLKEDVSIQEEGPIEGYALWSFEKKSIGSYFPFPLQFIFFLIWPMLWTFTSLLLEQWSLIVLVLSVLAFSVFLSFGKTLRPLWEWLEKIFLLDILLTQFKDFYNYYFQYRPQSFLFYLFYPVIIPFGLLGSARIRREFFIFMKLIGILIFFAALEILFSYSSLYPPYLNGLDALSILALQFLMLSIFMMFSILPTISTAFSLGFSGRRISLVLLSLLAFSTSFFAIYIYFESIHSRRYLNNFAIRRLDLRIHKAPFRADFQILCQNFLRSHQNGNFASAPSEVAFEESLSLSFEKQVGKFVAEDEKKAFHCFTLKTKNAQGVYETWLGIGVWFTQNTYFRPLVLMDPEKKCYFSWKTLPMFVQKTFVLSGPLPPERNQTRLPEIRYEGLLEEYRMLSTIEN